jgi:hypothetical protein
VRDEGLPAYRKGTDKEIDLPVESVSDEDDDPRNHVDLSMLGPETIQASEKDKDHDTFVRVPYTTCIGSKEKRRSDA